MEEFKRFLKIFIIICTDKSHEANFKQTDLRLYMRNKNKRLEQAQDKRDTVGFNTCAKIVCIEKKNMTHNLV